MMKEKIVAALQKLDPTNDNQWTQDGLPKLEALKFMVGETVTRDQVNEAAPGFTRANPVVEASNEQQSSEQPIATEQDTGTTQEHVATEPAPEAAGNDAPEQQEAQAGQVNNVVTDNVVDALFTGTITAAKVPQPDVRELKIGVNVDLDFMVKSFLKSLDFVNVTEMSDEDLALLHDKHTEILSVDNQVVSMLNELVTKRALYLASVEEEYHKRTPEQSQADVLMRFHTSVAENAHNLPVNKPRQLQTRGPTFFGK